MHFRQRNRREFITLLGGAAAWPVAARAQQPERRRIGVLQGLAANDPEGQDRFEAFFHALQQLGWTDGRNIQIVHRFTDGDFERARAYAAELVALAPDLILTSGASTAGAMLQVSRTVPVVFVGAADPVGAGFVDSLARPGGNATGFTSYEYSHERKVVGVAQRDRAGRETGGRPTGSQPYPPGPVSSARSRLRRHRSVLN